MMFTVRPVRAEDAPAWTALRQALWPAESYESLAEDVQRYLQDRDPMHVAVFVAQVDGEFAGFLELGLRPYSEGARSSPVPHVEGWYVAQPHPRAGIGNALLRAAEDWARERGYTELTSDTNLENELSLEVHLASGFTEVERLIAFHKAL